MLHLLNRLVRRIASSRYLNVVIVDFSQITLCQLSHDRGQPAVVVSYSKQLEAGWGQGNQRQAVLDGIGKDIALTISVNKRHDTVFVLAGVFTELLETAWPERMTSKSSMKEYLAWVMNNELFINDQQKIYTWQDIGKNRIISGVVCEQLINDLSVFGERVFGGVQGLYTLPQLYMKMIAHQSEGGDNSFIITNDSSWTLMANVNNKYVVRSYGSPDPIDRGQNLLQAINYIRGTATGSLTDIVFLGGGEPALRDFLADNGIVTAMTETDAHTVEGAHEAILAYQQFC